MLLNIELKAGYENKKVVLLVNKNMQHDSLGYNIVSAFLNFTYQLLKENKIKLWDSPFRNHTISFENLTTIESNQKTSYQNSENFFIYEFWTSNGKHSSFRMVGFSFSASSEGGKEINFGYIDFNEIADYLKLGKIDYNINGFCNVSFYQILMNKDYNYDLIYFNDKPIITHEGEKAEKDYLKGIEIKNKAFGKNVSNTNKIAVIPCKTITYEIRLFDYDLNSIPVFKSFEDYFNTNKQYLKILAGEDIYAMFRRSKLIITSFEVEEVFLYESATPKMYLLNITPKSFGKPYFELIAENLDTMNIFIDSIAVKKYILAKNFKYHLTKINGFPVNPAHTDIHIRQLMTGDIRRFRSEK